MGEKMIAEGEPSIDFTLEDHNGDEFTLSEYEEKKILLSFHPLAWTSVCAKQMQSLENNKKRFDELNTLAVGISIDSVPCKDAWADELGIEETRLLADFWPHGEVSRKYGIFRDDEGFSERANIIIDEDQKVIFSKVYPIREVPDIDEILEVLKRIREVNKNE